MILINKLKQQSQGLILNSPTIITEIPKPPIVTTKSEWDKISVTDMQNLISKVENFYAARNNPKINIIWLANTILTRLKNDLDYWVNAEGFKGYGKSNLILLLALMQTRYAGIWYNRETKRRVKVLPRLTPLAAPWVQETVSFDFKRNMSFLDSSTEVKNKYNSLDKYAPFVIDEGSKNLHKHNWQSKMQFLLVQLSDTERYQNKSCYVCFPQFRELNSVFRNDRIMMRLYLYAREAKEGYASCIMSLRDFNRHVSDPWHTDENARSFEYHLRRIPSARRSPKDILFAEKKLNGYAGDFDVPSLKVIAPRIWDIYFKYKADNAKKEYDENGEDETESKKILKWKYAFKMLVKKIKEANPDMSYKEIAAICNITPDTARTAFTTEYEYDKQERLNYEAKQAEEQELQQAFKRVH